MQILDLLTVKHPEGAAADHDNVVSELHRTLNHRVFSKIKRLQSLHSVEHVEHLVLQILDSVVVQLEGLQVVEEVQLFCLLHLTEAEVQEDQTVRDAGQRVLVKRKLIALVLLVAQHEFTQFSAVLHALQLLYSVPFQVKSF